jgi:hypothetical protein
MAPEPEPSSAWAVYVILGLWIAICTFLLGYLGAFPPITLRLFQHP